MLVGMLPFIAQEIPEGSYIAYFDCYDEQDENVLSMLRVIVPGEEEADNLVTIDIEWPPDGSFLYVLVIAEGKGIEFFTVKAPEDVTEEDGAIVTDNLRQMTLYVIDENAVVMQLGVDLYSMKAEGGSSVSHEKGIVAGYYTEDSSYAIEFSIQNHQTNNGQDLSIAGAVNCALYTDGNAVPICSIEYLVETTDPQGAPFDETAVDVVYPGKMTQEEFAVWFNEELLPSTMKTGLHIMSLLPNEVISAVILDTE
jgi:hypothetical protein